MAVNLLATEPTPWRTRRRDLALALFLFTAIGVLFLRSPVHQMGDSRYALLMSDSLLRYRTPALDHYRLPDEAATPTPAGPVGHYQLESARGHTYYYFPHGSSYLSLPYVALMRTAGLAAASPEGVYDAAAERRLQTRLAALLMAAFAAVVFAAARLLLPPRWALLIALGSALGTPVWSTASRALWSDTWAVLLLGFVVWLLLAEEVDGARPRPVLLASLLAWSYLVRPTNALAVAAVTVYFVGVHRRLAARYLLAGATWLTLFVAYAWHLYGHPLPTYYRASRLSLQSFGLGLATNLVSPSRGLLVLVPSVFFVAYLLTRYHSLVPAPRLVALALVVTSSHLIVVAAFPQWWAGHCYGPRFATGLVPWLALASIVAVRGYVSTLLRDARAPSPTRHRLELCAGATLLAASMFIHMKGATDWSTAEWNRHPIDVDQRPMRVWDWRHPQVLS